MKILTVVGARPQFIKAAPVSEEIRKVATEVLVHTGQHFDANMSDIFFESLGIPTPDFNLGIGGGSHGAMTGAMLAKIEEIVEAERPDWMLVYGDTNSTMAGALAAAKLHVPIAHVEAGLRSFNRRMPEEINRVVTDHLSTLLFAPTETAVGHLASEGIISGVHNVGDVMLDATRIFLERAVRHSDLLDTWGLEPQCFALATVHRAENTDDPSRLGNVMRAFGESNIPIVLPLHPRTRLKLSAFDLAVPQNVRVVEPLGYLEMLLVESRAKVILTDSGGVQKEAAFLGVPCLTLRDETEWTETVNEGWNVLVGTEPARILAALGNLTSPATAIRGFGNGYARHRMTELLVRLSA